MARFEALSWFVSLSLHIEVDVNLNWCHWELTTVSKACRSDVVQKFGLAPLRHVARLSLCNYLTRALLGAKSLDRVSICLTFLHVIVAEGVYHAIIVIAVASRHQLLDLVAELLRGGKWTGKVNLNILVVHWCQVRIELANDIVCDLRVIIFN